MNLIRIVALFLLLSAMVGCKDTLREAPGEVKAALFILLGVGGGALGIIGSIWTKHGKGKGRK